MKAPGSPSSAFATTYLGSPFANLVKLHFRPVGKPAPPRPLNFDALISSMTPSGVIEVRTLDSPR